MSDVELKRLYPGGLYACGEAAAHDPHPFGRRGWCPGIKGCAGKISEHLGLRIVERAVADGRTVQS